ncbi:3-oxo-tetronate kinase [Trueperella abortisuis]|uniref:3-oxo-tetronate kinase n=1 Tax=Trueperella abortisuis TaxID=445930 RepID=A0ABT9PFW3_9ACTO|nr:3-oxo-tetronate kinase [Trueperella abortisuis]MDP9831603.1 uncharacterized protein YgbK (DUF1537 family) [Trueperella abortisuis]
MGVRLGVIADDFTGATDIAGFLVDAGMSTVQLNEPSAEEIKTIASDTDAIVVGLKTRSAPSAEAATRSRQVLQALRSCGTEKFFFKYCSTFDSTEHGNIGPVTDALLDELGEEFTIIVPSLPVNGREVYHGYLFVNGELLSESGMRNHPINPMRDSNLMRLMNAQSNGVATNISYHTVRQGVEATKQALSQTAGQANYAVLDALTDAHLDIIGKAALSLKLVTGGSGLGAALARALIQEQGGHLAAPTKSWKYSAGKAIIFSGSSSDMTNRQVNTYRKKAPSYALNIAKIMENPNSYQQIVLTWLTETLASNKIAPLIFATASPEKVRESQEKFGVSEVSSAIENFFARLSQDVLKLGVTRFIVAGGETSGAVAQALGARGFYVGPQIDPGVPWTKTLDGKLDLALKSGNFGDEDFFMRAQLMTRHE